MQEEVWDTIPNWSNSEHPEEPMTGASATCGTLGSLYPSLH